LIATESSIGAVLAPAAAGRGRWPRYKEAAPQAGSAMAALGGPLQMEGR
jgi:hypothetical protein